MLSAHRDSQLCVTKFTHLRRSFIRVAIGQPLLTRSSKCCIRTRFCTLASPRTLTRLSGERESQRRRSSKLTEVLPHSDVSSANARTTVKRSRKLSPILRYHGATIAVGWSNPISCSLGRVYVSYVSIAMVSGLIAGQLPPKFHASIRSLRNANLLIVVGTSLTVHPFASLVDLVPDDCPRVLINLDEVGNFHRKHDIVLLGKCDDIVRELCRELGWEQELERAWAATADSVEVDDKPAVSETKAKVGEELDRITRDIEKSLTISKEMLGSVSNSDTGRTQGQKECPEKKGVDKKGMKGDSV